MRLGTVALTWGTALALVLGGCATDTEKPSPTKPTPTKPHVENHESAPESPIAFGLSVPNGAVQLGPLVRWRSDRLLEAYRLDLEVVEAEREAEAEQSYQEELAKDPEATRPTPDPVLPFDPTTAKDSFALLDPSPRADTFLSAMRINQEPSTVVRNMIAQLAALLPEADLVTDDLSEYCTSENRRVVECSLDVRGRTPVGRKLQIHLRVDPGDVATRTGNVAADEKPVMVLFVKQVGSPHRAQAIKEAEVLKDVQDVESTPDRAELIWPKMDESAPLDGPVVAGWTPPADVTVLLAGKIPQFATILTPRASDANDVAGSFLGEQLERRTPDPDVIVDLNERIITTHAVRKDATTVRTVQTTSARGNFVTVMLLPKGW